MKVFFYSHLEWIQLVSVGGLLPLQTLCQLGADLSRGAFDNNIIKQKHNWILYYYIYIIYTLILNPEDCLYLFVVCDDARWPFDLLLRLLKLSSKHLLQLEEEEIIL